MRGLIQLQNTLEHDPREPQSRRRHRGHPADARRFAHDPRQGGDRDPRGELRRPRVRVADPQDRAVRRGTGEGDVGAQVRPDGRRRAGLPRPRAGGAPWAAAKRASMREGPLAALFRKTDEDAAQRCAQSPAAPPTERLSARGMREPPPRQSAPEPLVRPRHPISPRPPRRARRARSARPIPPWPQATRHREPAVPAVPTPQERLRAAFSSELPSDMLERRASAVPSTSTRAPTTSPAPASAQISPAAAARRRRRRRRRQRRQPDGRGRRRRRRVHRGQHRSAVAAAVHRGRHRAHRRRGHARARLRRGRRARPDRRDGGVRQAQVAAEGLGHGVHHRRRRRRHRNRARRPSSRGSRARSAR